MIGETGLLSSLDRAAEGDVEALMQWFPDERSAREWGGPFIRYPFDAASFREDLRWGSVASVVQRSGADGLLAFGQYYERYGRMHLARLAVNPVVRGRGFGRDFVSRLMTVARADMDLAEFALFVYRDNERACRCYASLGFRPADYPDGAPLAGEAIYMTRPVRQAGA